MSDHTCTRSHEIDQIKADIDRMRDIQFKDHDLLVQLDVKVSAIPDLFNRLALKVDLLMQQPSDRYEKLKLTGATAIIVYAITFISNFLFKG